MVMSVRACVRACVGACAFVHARVCVCVGVGVYVMWLCVHVPLIPRA